MPASIGDGVDAILSATKNNGDALKEGNILCKDFNGGKSIFTNNFMQKFNLNMGIADSVNAKNWNENNFAVLKIITAVNSGARGNFFNNALKNDIGTGINFYSK